MTTMRPSPFSWTGVLAVVVVGVTVWQAARAASSNTPLAVPVLLTALACVEILVALVFLMTTRLEFSAGRYRFTAWGRTREFDASEVRVAVLVDQMMGPGQITGFAPPALFAMGSGRERLLRLEGVSWRRADLTAVALDLETHGAKVDRLDHARPAELTGRYPFTLTLWERHPVLIIGVTMAGLLALLVIVSVVVSLLGFQP